MSGSGQTPAASWQVLLPDVDTRQFTLEFSDAHAWVTEHCVLNCRPVARQRNNVASGWRSVGSMCSTANCSIRGATAAGSRPGARSSIQVFCARCASTLRLQHRRQRAPFAPPRLGRIRRRRRAPAARSTGAGRALPGLQQAAGGPGCRARQTATAGPATAGRRSKSAARGQNLQTARRYATRRWRRGLAG